MGKHALLSASGAHRWLMCPPSAVFERDHGIKGTTEYADEGTAAHKLAEMMLRYSIYKDISPTTAKTAKKRITDFKKTDKFYCEEMGMHVAKYVDYVLELENAYTGAYIDIEQQVNYSDIAKKGYGTVDCNIFDAKTGTLHVIDLKYGRGVEVSVENNPQLMLYGYGLMCYYESRGSEVNNIELHIVQPRLNAIGTWGISARKLSTWANKKVKPVAKIAYMGKGEYKSGDWCRFCSCSSICKTLIMDNFNIVQDMKNPNIMTDKELTNILNNKAKITNWLKSVEDYALDRALKGDKIKGFKLVLSSAMRKINIPPQKIEKILLKKGFLFDEIYNLSLISMTQIEKLMGKADFQAEFNKYIEIKEGNKVLVPENDKRKEIESSAKDDFANII